MDQFTTAAVLGVSPCGHMRRVIIRWSGCDLQSLIGQRVRLDNDEVKVLEAVPISDWGMADAVGLTVTP